MALEIVPELSCGSAPWRNLIIERDSFEALRHLRMSFAGQLKCIYIDPPSNTGNRDFVYNDRFVDKEDSWRHSKWCEFTFQRLMITRDLLRQDGAIFVSIDDNGMPALALLMKRIFGKEYFVATFLWRRRTTSDSRNLNGVSGDHEYVLCFQKDEERSLVTLDRDFANPLVYPHDRHAGVAVLLLPRKPTRANFDHVVATLAEALRRQSLEKQLWIVELGRIRVHLHER